MIVTFLFSNGTTNVPVNYKPYDNEHTNLWLNSMRDMVENHREDCNGNHLYNFSGEDELSTKIDLCNDTIDKLNTTFDVGIKNINAATVVEDINFVHTYFVDKLHNDTTPDQLWHELNFNLHATESVLNYDSFAGMAFIELFDSITYDLPESAYEHFTPTKKYGMCYANYPHVGRHILEMFNARDTFAEDDHILPMTQINAGSYLWFGKDSKYDHNQFMQAIGKWYDDAGIQQRINMEWGDPKLAVGWLPVAEMVNDVTPQDLQGMNSVVDILITDE